MFRPDTLNTGLASDQCRSLALEEFLDHFVSSEMIFLILLKATETVPYAAYDLAPVFEFSCDSSLSSDYNQLIN